jgi:hypothetical protein
MYYFAQKMGWATFWATFLQNSSGHPENDRPSRFDILFVCDVSQLFAIRLLLFNPTLKRPLTLGPLESEKTEDGSLKNGVEA